MGLLKFLVMEKSQNKMYIPIGYVTVVIFYIVRKIIIFDPPNKKLILCRFIRSYGRV